VDIPRLRVAVFATNTTTELFFRQAVGRLVRWTRGMRHQKSFFFIPDDARLRAFAANLAQQRRHSLHARRGGGADDDGEAGAELDELPSGAERPEDEQLSLFAAISAVALGEPHTPEWIAEDPGDDLGAGAPDGGEADDGELTIALSPPPRPGGAGAGAGATATAHAHRTRREHKTHLRHENAEWAREIVRLSGLSHAQVNSELNRLSGVRRISEATVEQLESRRRHAEGWLRRL
jgi:hypothetical protein